MRNCTKCQQTKPLEDFAFRSKTLGKRSTVCKECHSTYARQHYESNRLDYIGRASKSRPEIVRRNREWLSQYKSGKPCLDCGQGFPHYVMDFDHIGDKKAAVSRLLGYSMETLLVEIAKCDLVCANCHRIRTYRRYHEVTF